MLVDVSGKLYELLGNSSANVERHLSISLGYLDYKNCRRLDEQIKLISDSYVQVDLPDTLLDEAKANLPVGYDLSQGVNLFLLAGFLLGVK